MSLLNLVPKSRSLRFSIFDPRRDSSEGIAPAEHYFTIHTTNLRGPLDPEVAQIGHFVWLEEELHSDVGSYEALTASRLSEIILNLQFTRVLSESTYSAEKLRKYLKDLLVYERALDELGSAVGKIVEPLTTLTIEFGWKFARYLSDRDATIVRAYVEASKSRFSKHQAKLYESVKSGLIAGRFTQLPEAALGMIGILYRMHCDRLDSLLDLVSANSSRLLREMLGAKPSRQVRPLSSELYWRRETLRILERMFSYLLRLLTCRKRTYLATFPISPLGYPGPILFLQWTYMAWMRMLMIIFLYATGAFKRISLWGYFSKLQGIVYLTILRFIVGLKPDSYFLYRSLAPIVIASAPVLDGLFRQNIDFGSALLLSVKRKVKFGLKQGLSELEKSIWKWHIALFFLRLQFENVYAKRPRRRDIVCVGEKFENFCSRQCEHCELGLYPIVTRTREAAQLLRSTRNHPCMGSLPSMTRANCFSA